MEEKSLVLKDRNILEVNLVKKIKSFNSEEIFLVTQLGDLYIKGESLILEKMNLENSSLLVKGKINLMRYSDYKEKNLKRIFK